MANQLTPEELQQINLIKNDALEIASSLGQLQYQKITIELEQEELKAKIKRIKQKENEVFEEIRSKYGDVSINIETGEIS
jgi:stress response protein YsnF